MNFPMKQYKTRGGGLCGKMYEVSVSKGRALKAWRTLTTLENPQVEVGLSLYELCSRLTTNPEEEQHHLGYHKSTHEDDSLHNNEKYMDLRPIGPSLPRGDSLIASCVEFYRVGPGH